MTHRISLFLLLCMLTLSSCAQRNDKAKGKAEAKPIAIAPEEGESMATFASGCFWCAEEIFESILGVREVISGYSGGSASDATYEKVSNGVTDHAESV